MSLPNTLAARLRLARRRSAATDLSIGADVIVAARIAAVLFIAVFIMWAEVPHRVPVVGLLGAVIVTHVAWWAMYVRAARPITFATALSTLLCDTIGIGIAVILTGGAESPAVLVWAPNVAVAAIWLGVRRSLPVLAVVLAFLAAAAVKDPGGALQLTEVQYGMFAAFMLALIVAHGGIVAARQQSVLGVIAAAQDQARRDPLTGLLNRLALDERLPEELERARRHDRPLALMIIDLDDFKIINDTQGHLAGDAVLVGVADDLRREMRRSDSVVRLGGEEFLMLLPDTDEASAVALAERLRSRVLSSPACGGVTVSIGIASYSDTVRDADDLIGAADEALYVAKRSGKNQTRLHSLTPASLGQLTLPVSAPPAGGAG